MCSGYYGTVLDFTRGEIYDKSMQAAITKPFYAYGRF
jgi:hypothetical protein